MDQHLQIPTLYVARQPNQIGDDGSRLGALAFDGHFLIDPLDAVPVYLGGQLGEEQRDRIARACLVQTLQEWIVLSQAGEDFGTGGGSFPPPRLCRAPAGG